MDPPPSPARRRILSFQRHDRVGVGLTLALVAAFLCQPFVQDPFGRLGVSGFAFAQGAWWTLATHVFVHGGVAHLAFNALALLGLARQLSPRTGAGRLLLLFAVSGLAGGLAFLALQPAGLVPAVGASGAISGLWGAAARLAPVHAGAAPLASGPVLKTVRDFVVSNALLFGVFFLLTRGMGGIAWEAHLGGFALGLLAAPLFAQPPRGPWG